MKLKQRNREGLFIPRNASNSGVRTTCVKRREENNGDGLLRLPKCKEHCLFGANMLSVTCNMLSFVRDSVGRAYAALKLSIIKTGVVSKGSTA